jgi:hypothetical protein
MTIIVLFFLLSLFDVIFKFFVEVIFLNFIGDLKIGLILLFPSYLPVYVIFFITFDSILSHCYPISNSNLDSYFSFIFNPSSFFLATFFSLLFNLLYASTSLSINRFLPLLFFVFSMIDSSCFLKAESDWVESRLT